MYYRAVREAVYFICSPLLPERQTAITVNTLTNPGVDFQARELRNPKPRKKKKDTETALGLCVKYSIVIISMIKV